MPAKATRSVSALAELGSSKRMHVSHALALAVGALGLLVLLGWTLRSSTLKSVLPGYTAMNPLTAVCFVSLSAGLLVASERPKVTRVIGLVVAVIASLKLAELFFGLPIGVDQLLFRTELQGHGGQPPNRLAPNTAACLLLLALSLASLGPRVGKFAPSELLAFLAGLPGFFALVGYGYGVHTFYRVGPFIPMAIHTAGALFVSTWAVLLVRADHGVAALLFRDSLAGAMTRRLLPAALFLPPMIGWLRLWGERLGLYPSEVGVALFAVTLTLLLLLIVFTTAGSLERTDALRIRAQQQLEEVALRLARSNEELERLATTDSLTGLHNRRAWLERAESELANATRYKTPLSVLMVDADHFKRINDVHGHQIGDLALCAMAQCLSRQLRQGDFLARYGGEEFCILLPRTGAEAAMVVAQRCCAAMRELEVLGSSGVRVEVRCSVGVAELGSALRTTRELLRAADAALYAAKTERNCVRRASPTQAASLT
ncbi:MAG: multi-sensor signal transduction histidine kinase [Myxococcaceae bacterium]|nr:multi-sensor signal transduction histidine kinase [Myxococcaceae bacterium]